MCENHDYCYVEMPEKDKKNIKIQPRREIFEGSIYYLC